MPHLSPHIHTNFDRILQCRNAVEGGADVVFRIWARRAESKEDKQRPVDGELPSYARRESWLVRYDARIRTYTRVKDLSEAPRDEGLPTEDPFERGLEEIEILGRKRYLKITTRML